MNMIVFEDANKKIFASRTINLPIRLCHLGKYIGKFLNEGVSFVVKDDHYILLGVDDYPYKGTLHVISFPTSSDCVKVTHITSHILVKDKDIVVKGMITKSHLIDAAKDHKIRNFIIMDLNGDYVYEENLPYAGTVKLKKYTSPM